MTKVTILGDESKEEKKLKPIEFVKYFSKNENCNFLANCVLPKEYGNIELICENYSSGLDLMFAYSLIRNEGYLYLGHFNDGIVE